MDQISPSCWIQPKLEIRVFCVTAGQNPSTSKTIRKVFILWMVSILHGAEKATKIFQLLEHQGGTVPWDLDTACSNIVEDPYALYLGLLKLSGNLIRKEAKDSASLKI